MHRLGVRKLMRVYMEEGAFLIKEKNKPHSLRKLTLKKYGSPLEISRKLFMRKFYC